MLSAENFSSESAAFAAKLELERAELLHADNLARREVLLHLLDEGAEHVSTSPSVRVVA